MKTDISDLAVFSGQPAFINKLHVGRPNIGNRETLLERINDILDKKWLTNAGPYVEEFEQQIANFLGIKHCIATCNGTVALEIAIRALGLDGEVIVPSFTFVATAHALKWLGVTPVFCDINPDTYNIDPSEVEKLITPNTTGILGVHVFGRPCNTDALREIAKRNNLRLLFDAAHAFGCSHNGRMIGNFGNAEVLSFHATKFFNTFEGGAVVTNDDDLAEKIRLMKNFGFAGHDNVISLGINGKMTEVAAAMGLTGLESLHDFTEVNYRNYKAYQKYLEDIPGVKIITHGEAEKQNYQYIIVEVDENITGISRDQVVEILHAENVLARRYFYPGCHEMEPYRSLFPHAGLLLPETERIAKRVMALPTGTTIGKDEIHTICDIICFVVKHSGELHSRLGK